MISVPIDLSSGIFSDVVLQIAAQDGSVHKYRAHRLLLASKSCYFSILFTKMHARSEEIVSLPSFFDPLAFDCLLQFLYGMEMRLSAVNIVPKIVEIADCLNLTKDIETVLNFSLKSTIESATIEDLTLLYRSLKTATNHYDTSELYNEVIAVIENCLCANIKKLIASELIVKLPEEVVIHLLEKSLSNICDDDTLGAVLEELRSRMKADTLFQMLGMVIWRLM